MPLTLLFVSANYKESKVVRVERERKEVYNTLESSSYRNLIEIKEAPAMERKDFLKLLIKYKPQIIHFSGHGEVNKGPLFEEDEFQEVADLEQDLINILKIFKDSLKLVIFNCCHCATIAEKVSEFIDCTIGPKISIDDNAAIAFSKGFYEGFFNNGNLEVSFDSGVRQYNISKFRGDRKDYEIYFNRNFDIETLHANLDSSFELIEQIYNKYLNEECGTLILDSLPTDEYILLQQFPLVDMYIPLHFEELSETDLLFGIPKKELPFEISKRQLIVEEEIKYQSKSEIREKISLKDLLLNDKAIIIAPPGSGKTTLLKRISLTYSLKINFKDDIDDIKIFPLFIRCRKLTEIKTQSLLRVFFNSSIFFEIEEYYDLFYKYIKDKISSNQLLLLLDGLDEISDQELRILFVEKLKNFLSLYPNIKVIITSREAGIRILSKYLTPYFKSFKIAELDENDIKELTKNYLKKTMSNTEAISKKIQSLWNEIDSNSQVRLLANNPLILTTLLLVRRRIGSFPTNKTSLYRNITELLLFNWNIEGHKTIDIGEAIPQLSYIAFKMMKERKNEITLNELKNLLVNARRQFPAILGYSKMSISEFINQVELRSSLLIRSGFKSENGLQLPVYEFKHLTFLEYFTAIAITNHYYDNNQQELSPINILEDYFEDDLWNEVIPFVSSLLGSKAEPFLKFLLDFYKNLKGIKAFYFISILSQCLVEQIQITPSLAKKIIFEIVSLSTKIPYPHFEFILQGKFRDLLIEITYSIYNSGNYTMASSVLGIIGLDHLNWSVNYQISVDLLKKITDLISNKELNHRLLGFCALDITYMDYIFDKDFNQISKEFIPYLKIIEDKTIKFIYSDDSGELYATLTILSILGRFRAWEVNVTPHFLKRLFTLLEKSKDVLRIRILQAIGAFPINKENYKSLNPDKSIIKYINHRFSNGFLKRKTIYIDDLLELLAAFVLSIHFDVEKYTKEKILDQIRRFFDYFLIKLKQIDNLNQVYELRLIKNICKIFGEDGEILFEEKLSELKNYRK